MKSKGYSVVLIQFMQDKIIKVALSISWTLKPGNQEIAQSIIQLSASKWIWAFSSLKPKGTPMATKTLI
jgi:hypothetical protein